ncbi:MAG: GntR family transcriptional regulator [Rhodospirillales bacterium]|nr:GntR family transcriptional regulator [Acetobacter sp.]
MSSIRPLQSLPLTQQICEALCTAAARGHFLPGERLIEAELAQELGVSRIPVREALHLLASLGLVENEPYKGMRLMAATTRDCRERFITYRALTMEALRSIAAQLPEPSRWQDLRADIDAAREAAIGGDKAAVTGAIGRFFDQFFDAAANKVMLRLVQIMHIQFAVYVSLFSTDESLVEFPAFLDQALDAIGVGDFGAAEEALSRYLDPGQVGDVEGALAAAWKRREEQSSVHQLRLRSLRP